MRILVAVVVLTALALLGSQRMRAGGTGASALHTLLGGSELMLVGLLLGRDFIGLVDEATLEGLRPFVFVALGWLAFLFGLQFERRTLAHLPAGFAAISASVAATTLAVVAPTAVALLSALGDAPPRELALAAAALAASAACTGQSAIAVVDRRLRPAARQVMTVLRLVSSLDPAVGVTVFGVALSLLAPRATPGGDLPWSLQWPVAAVCLGLLTAWLFVSLTVTRTNQAELVLYLLGVIALASGVALGFGLSVLFINFVCGLAVANLTQLGSIRVRVMDLMVRSESFLYLLLLVVAGACWRLPAGWAAAAVAVYAIVRLAGKAAGAWLATRPLARRHPVPPLLGLGLASQGGMGLAILLEYRFAAAGTAAATAVGIGLTAVFAAELAAPWLVRRIAHRGWEAAP